MRDEEAPFSFKLELELGLELELELEVVRDGIVHFFCGLRVGRVCERVGECERKALIKRGRCLHFYGTVQYSTACSFSCLSVRHGMCMCVYVCVEREVACTCYTWDSMVGLNTEMPALAECTRGAAVPGGGWMDGWVVDDGLGDGWVWGLGDQMQLCGLKSALVLLEVGRCGACVRVADQAWVCLARESLEETARAAGLICRYRCAVCTVGRCKVHTYSTFCTPRSRCMSRQGLARIGVTDSSVQSLNACVALGESRDRLSTRPGLEKGG